MTTKRPSPCHNATPDSPNDLMLPYLPQRPREHHHEADTAHFDGGAWDRLRPVTVAAMRHGKAPGHSPNSVGCLVLMQDLGADPPPFGHGETLLPGPRPNRRSVNSRSD